MDKIVYTCITGEYDLLREVYKQSGWHYICFTDKNIVSRTWEIKKIESGDKKCREVKIMADIYLPPHDVSVWVDGNIEIECNLDDVVKGKTYCVMGHPSRNNILEEAEACIRLGKDKKEVIDEQMARYRNAGYGFDNGLVATGVIIRRNSTRRDIAKNATFNREWWKEVQRGSRRDQLSFNYVAWELGMKYQTIPFLDGFRLCGHVKKFDINT